MPLQQQHAVDFIVETLMARPAGTVTLCTLGPMTNIGLALVREPRIAGRLKQIVAMGGGYFEQGNVTPAAEFNIYVDPHAARLVFDFRDPDHADPARLHSSGADDAEARRGLQEHGERIRPRHRRHARFLRALR